MPDTIRVIDTSIPPNLMEYVHVSLNSLATCIRREILDHSPPMMRVCISSGRVLICIVDPFPLLRDAIGIDMSAGFTRDSNLAT